MSGSRKKWSEEYKAWNRRELSDKTYIYWWADGDYFNIRGDNAHECMLIIIGATPEETKELVAIEDGFRECDQSWTEVLQDLKSSGLKKGPKLAVGDGALGFWKALNKPYPSMRQQPC